MISKDILERCVGFSSVYDATDEIDTIILKVKRKGILVRWFFPYTYMSFKFSRITEIRNGKRWAVESLTCASFIKQLNAHFDPTKLFH